MARILVDLPDDQLAELSMILSRQPRPRAAVIREAVAEYIANHRISADAAVKVFGLWQQREVDGLAYQEEMRSEW